MSKTKYLIKYFIKKDLLNMNLNNHQAVEWTIYMGEIFQQFRPHNKPSKVKPSALVRIFAESGI
jgi:hypothetical protein